MELNLKFQSDISTRTTIISKKIGQSHGFGHIFPLCVVLFGSINFQGHHSIFELEYMHFDTKYVTIAKKIV